MYDCCDGHTSELAKVARKETAFPLWRATESRWKRNMIYYYYYYYYHQVGVPEGGKN